MLGVLGLLVVFLAVLCVVGLIVGIVLWSTGGSGGGSSEMSCGACGYEVRGLSHLTCPECGADLREVGIKRGASAGKRTTGIILTVCCSGLLLLGCGGTGFLFMAASPSNVQHVPAVQAMPAPQTGSSAGTIIQNPDGSTTLTNPDGSTITTQPDGSTTLTQPDGTTKSFDPNGVEVTDETP